MGSGLTFRILDKSYARNKWSTQRNPILKQRRILTGAEFLAQLFEWPFSIVIAKLFKTMLQIDVMIKCIGEILLIQFPAIEELSKKNYYPPFDCDFVQRGRLPPWVRQHCNSRPNTLLKFPQFCQDRWERTDRIRFYRYAARLSRSCATLSWMNSRLPRMPHAYNLWTREDKWVRLLPSGFIVVVAAVDTRHLNHKLVAAARTQQTHRFSEIINTRLWMICKSTLPVFWQHCAQEKCQLNQTHYMLWLMFTHQAFDYSVWITRSRPLQTTEENQALEFNATRWQKSLCKFRVHDYDFIIIIICTICAWAYGSGSGMCAGVLIFWHLTTIRAK